MDSSGHQLHIFVFPYMAHGHMIPTVDLAKLFALRGLKATIITTPLNAPLISKTIQRTKGLTRRQPCSKNLLKCSSKSANLIALLLICSFHGLPMLLPNLGFQADKKQLPDGLRQDFDTDYSKLMSEIVESELKSFGIVVNSFYEVEPAYVDYYRKVLGRRAWPIGPVSLCNRGIEDKAQRGNEASISENECLKWLDSKKPNSVIYICFGSMVNFNASQLIEIARALEASKQEFIWAVRRDKKNQEDEEDWLPKGFEERMGGTGLIIRGWAPQVLILDHEAIGGFLTHCGWGSVLEVYITSGKPMVTWPVFADHFYNEKLVSEVLHIGVGVGVKEWVAVHGEHVKSEAIETAITEVMVSGQAEEMRRRARKLGEMARKAVEEGGSTYFNLNDLVEELRLPGIAPKIRAIKT
ncbi:hypothetical protein GH714_015668 [Hevea brasiliensis]|uniref:Glycosyltransferase n=1 Tax=Hevea brasiliensis TaxID=3981 RepID=A0A6A6L050_HEVBR|nr:hypothetical protein GH714_015668 [Hevea brasiliensis]